MTEKDFFKNLSDQESDKGKEEEIEVPDLTKEEIEEVEKLDKEKIEDLEKEINKDLEKEKVEKETKKEPAKEKESDKKEKTEEKKESKKEKTFQELQQARDNLIKAEINFKKYQGIKGFFKSIGDGKDKVEQEYEKAKKEYEGKKAEIFGENLNSFLNERLVLTDLRAQEYNQEKGFGQKFYDSYKKLGEWNIARLLGKETIEKLESQEDDPRVKKILKGTGRFLTKTLSVRLGISFGLLGAGFAFGGGIGLAGALAARKGLIGVGTGFGTYDLIKMFGEKKELKRGMKKELTPAELAKMNNDEILERMTFLEQEAENTGEELGQKNKLYNSLKEQFLRNNKEVDPSDKFDILIKGMDEKLEEARKRAQEKDLKRKGIAIGVGTFMGSGLFGQALGEGKDFISDLFKGEAVTAAATEEFVSNTATEGVDLASEVPVEEVPVSEAPIEELSEEPLTESEIEKEIKDLKAEKEGIAAGLTAAAEESEEVFVPESLEYQGGTSIWKEVENQLKERSVFKQVFEGADQAEQTHAIDYFKDKIAADPQEYGLAEGVDVDELTADQMEKIDWNKLMELEDPGEVDKAFPELSDSAKQNIIENDKILQEYGQKTGEALDTDTVDQVLNDVKEAGGVENYLRSEQVSQATSLSELNELGVENMTEEQERLWAIYNEYLGTNIDDYTPVSEGAQKGAEEYLNSLDPEQYDQYSDIKAAVQEIRANHLNEELQKGQGFLHFGQPDPEKLIEHVQALTETYNLGEKEQAFFSQWLAGEDGVLKADDFKDFLSGEKLDNFNLEKFDESIEIWQEKAQSIELPQENIWEPKYIINEQGEKQLVNIRAAEDGYQIDSVGNGEADGNIFIGHSSGFYKADEIRQILPGAQIEG
jgi:hypothetical protein